MKLSVLCRPNLSSSISQQQLQNIAMSTTNNDFLSIVNDWVVWTTTSLPIYKQSSSTVLDANVVPYLFLTLLFTTVVFIVEAYLDRRQLSRFSGPKCVLPKELVDFVTSETFDKSVAYGKDKFAFKIFEVEF